MKDAAADLEFETGERLRDEIKRLRETELAISDDPLARQSDVDDRTGGYRGEKKYGASANLPPEKSPPPPPRGTSPSRGEGTRGPSPRPSPLDEAKGHPLPSPLEGEVAHSAGGGDANRSRIKTEYEPVQPTYAQSTSRLARGDSPSASQPPRAEQSRIKKPSLDDMGPGTDRPVPARAPNVDPRTKAGAFGEEIRGPHKPTLDEMGPHAMLPPRNAGKPLPEKPKMPTRTIEFEESGEKTKRRGRPKKTGRPGQ